MASSQVQLVSSPPFRCVLRDRNRRERCRESNANATQAAFQKNLKDLVRDQLNNCIAVPSGSDVNENSNFSSSQTRNSNFDNRQRLRLPNHNNSSKIQIDNGSPISARQSRLLDRWAAKQAQEIVSTIKQEVELLSSSNSPEESTEIVPPPPPSPPDGGGSVEPHNQGASSLVQMWEARLKPPNNINLGLTIYTSRTNSGSSIVEEPSRGSEAGDSIEERCDTPRSDRHTNEDFYVDSDYDRTPHSDRPLSSHSCNSDAGEREKVRVADIIRRLTSANPIQISVVTPINEDNYHDQAVVANESSSREQRSSPVFDQTDHRNVLQITCSPRIRGRQAFQDLLCQMVANRRREIDSLFERRAVSKFSQRGRIQSLLRLRVLQRGNGILDQWPPQAPRIEGKRVQHQGSNIVQLRERFSTGIEHGMTGPSDTPSTKCPANNTPNVSNTSTSTRTSENRSHQECYATEQPSTATAQQQKNPKDGAKTTINLSNSSSSNRPSESSHNHEVNTNEQQRVPTAQHQEGPCTEMVKNTPNLRDSSASNPSNENAHNCEVKTTEQQHKSAALPLRSPCKEIVNIIQNLSGCSSCNQLNEESNQEETETTEQKGSLMLQPLTSVTENLHEEANPISLSWPEISIEDTNLNSQETVDTTGSMNEWNGSDITEEEESDDQQQFDVPNYDWISDISRPRSYWEDQRRAWYEEILNTNSTNEEIRQLLERKQVSSFLDSDFRVRMDRLMMSHLQLQTREEVENENAGEDRMDQLLSVLQRHADIDASHEEEGEGTEQDEDNGEMEEEDNEDHNQLNGQFHESTNYFNQSTPSLPSPSLLRSWSFQDNEVADDSDQVASTTSNQPRSSSMYYQDAHNISSSRTSTSLEMELIYDLKGHMEQLHREMSELKETIKSCMDMQAQMRESIKMEAHPEETKKSLKGKKGVCCICLDMKVDSLLYRCGHMCTCLKCAHELQWSSGKCPICRAPIVDVVQTYTDS